MADTDSSEPSVHTDAEHARAGETPGIVRYVLGISLLLAIIAMSAVWILPALFTTK